jgi:hypothetical protein
MGVGYNLGDLRAAIDDINREVLSEKATGEVLNSDVLARLKKTRSQLLDAFTPQLVNIALTKLLNEVCRGNAAKNTSGLQSALFAEYLRIPKRVTISKGLKKATEKLTLHEAKDWVENHSNRTVNTDNDGFEKLIDDCEKIAKSETETIEEILNRKIKKSQSQQKLI